MNHETKTTAEWQPPCTRWASCMSSICLLSVLLFVLWSGMAVSQVITTDKMATDIRVLLPSQDPYCNGNYPSFSFDPAEPTLCMRVEVGDAIPTDVVDWVLLELRAAASGGSVLQATEVVARKPAFLLSNGRVVDAQKYAKQIADGGDNCTVAGLATLQANCPDVAFVQVYVEDDEGLYLVVRHRNHLDIISNMDITDNTSTNDKGQDIYTYDFSDAQSRAYNSSRALKSKDGIFVMYGGDVIYDTSSRIQLDDYTTNITDLIGTSRYHPADTNFSGIITPADYSDIIAENLDEASQVPSPTP